MTSVFVVICFFLSISVYSQQEDLVLKANQTIYTNPDDAIKIAEHLLKTSQNNQNTAIANLLLSKSYLVKGDYNKAIIYAFDDINLSDNIEVKTRIENNIIKATLLRKLYIDKQSQDYLNNARQLSKELTSDIDKYKNLIALEHINLLIDRRKTDEALAAIKSVENQFSNFYDNNIDEKKAIYLAKEQAFIDQSKIDSAEVYMNKLLTLVDSFQVNNIYKKALIYTELGYLQLQQKEFKKSEQTMLIALRISEILNNPNLLKIINKILAINYLASNQKIQHKVYYDEFLVLNNQVDLIEQKAVNTLFNILSNEIENSTKIEEKRFNNYYYTVLTCYFIILIIAFFIVLKSENRKKRLNEIINYLEISRTNFIKSKPPKKTNSKRIIIPEDTEKSILIKLKRFENSNKFLHKDLSQAGIAVQFDTNTKYLSEIINKHYDENFNAFINRLRINYIINKLKSDPNYINYKISYLAEECGYASHSGFATVFKSIVGLSPVTFINLIREEKEANLSKKNIG